MRDDDVATYGNYGLSPKEPTMVVAVMECLVSHLQFGRLGRLGWATGSRMQLFSSWLGDGSAGMNGIGLGGVGWVERETVR